MLQEWALFTLPCLTVMERDGNLFHHKIHTQTRTITTTIRNIAGLVFCHLLHRLSSVHPVGSMFIRTSSEMTGTAWRWSGSPASFSNDIRLAVPKTVLREAVWPQECQELTNSVQQLDWSWHPHRRRRARLPCLEAMGDALFRWYLFTFSGMLGLWWPTLHTCMKVPNYFQLIQLKESQINFKAEFVWPW